MILLMNISYVPNLTLGHELGHNLGLDHDWVTEPEPGKYPYAHGWIPPSKKWRTIMAYPGGCALRADQPLLRR
ncbi:reprolysin-like metallopeptidase [Kitasatospora gansuensis]